MRPAAARSAYSLDNMRSWDFVGPLRTLVPFPCVHNGRECEHGACTGKQLHMAPTAAEHNVRLSIGEPPS
eukprot:scaffold90347_cov14-Tisochrysis_lutea.AAC.1